MPRQRAKLPKESSEPYIGKRGIEKARQQQRVAEAKEPIRGVELITLKMPPSRMKGKPTKGKPQSKKSQRDREQLAEGLRQLNDGLLRDGDLQRGLGMLANGSPVADVLKFFERDHEVQQATRVMVKVKASTEGEERSAIPDQSDWSKLIRDRIRAEGWSAYALGQASGVDASIILRFIAGQRDIRLETTQKLCQALGLALVTLKDDAD